MGNKGGVWQGRKRGVEGKPQTDLGGKGWGEDHFTPLTSALILSVYLKNM